MMCVENAECRRLGEKSKYCGPEKIGGCGIVENEKERIASFLAIAVT
jgi:hypothetical protein